MCGRYYIADDDRLGELVRRLADLQDAPVKTGEISPGDSAPVILQRDGLKAAVLRWGIDFGYSRPVINARSETAAEKPAFSELLSNGRLLVPASAYFEWDGERKRHTLGDRSGGIYMAGLFRGERFVILTRAAQGPVSGIHPRMPVIFQKSDGLAWLNTRDTEILKRACTDSISEV